MRPLFGVLSLLVACADPKGSTPVDSADSDDSGDAGDSGDTSDSGDTAPDPVGELFALPGSALFGVTADGLPRDAAHTLYRVPAPTGDQTDDLVQPWFDVSNNSLIAELDARGRLEYPVVLGPLAGHPQGTAGGELYAADAFLAGSPWSLSLAVDGGAAVALDTVEGVSVEVLDGRFFRWTFPVDDLDVRLIPVAPTTGPDATAQPRGVLLLVEVQNHGAEPRSVTLAPPSTLRRADALDASLSPATLYGAVPEPVPANYTDARNRVPRFAEVGPVVPGYEAILPVGADAPATGTTWELSVAPGEAGRATWAYLVGGGTSELAHTRDQLAARSVGEWAAATREQLADRTGRLDIPAAPWVAEVFVRHAMIAQDAYLVDGEGRLRTPRGGSWVLMGMLSPDFVGGILPEGSLGLPCPFLGVSRSLYQSTLTSVMAADYYRWGGDPAFFADSPTYEAETRCLVEDLLASRYADVSLYPSTYIWDGPSRGDYHVGSNLLVWFVLTHAARVADEVWGDTATSAAWAAEAEALRVDLEALGTVEGYFGVQLAEGTWADGHVDDAALSHDGEEVAVAMAPLLGFLEPDDPRRIAHGKAAMSTQNLFYAPELDAMYWSEEFPVTAPGWIPWLSGAASEAGTAAAFEALRARTDVDGALYWWPYDNPESDPTAIRRRVSHAWGGTPIDTPKVDYATSVFASLLVHDVLGLSGDLPRRTVSFRPAPPWPAFTWEDAHLGRARFDLAYEDDGTAITARLTNREPVEWAAVVEVVVPTGMVAVDPPATGVRYTRDSVSLDVPALAPGDSAELRVTYAPYPASACLTDAWEAARAAHDALPGTSWEENAWADADGNGLPEGWELRMTACARCADPEVAEAWAANEARCAGLGWGEAWTRLCADYATTSSGLRRVVDGWNGRALGLVPFARGGAEPLAAEGDLDGDTRTNAAEFDANGARSGSPERYATLACGG